MAIGTMTMILTSVGLQIYNNWSASRLNSELQQKREKFERAARERNTEHMWKLLREGQELTIELEKEKHAERLRELKDDVDHLLERLTYESTISNWPLKVLPIVMKNQAFGNLLANQEENVALHVIFTRSNSDGFNRVVFHIIEKKLEQYCEQYWSTLSDHPILFYSGAWKPASAPTDVQIAAMRSELQNLPTLVITPFFRPNDGKLVFQVHIWGVGVNSTDKFDVPEIVPNNFQREFGSQDDYDSEEELLDEIVEDLVPYLECLIGYMADTYFWSSAGLAPHLPMLVSQGSINTDGIKYLVCDSNEYYDKIFSISDKCESENPFLQNHMLDLYEGSSYLWDDETKMRRLITVFMSYVKKRNGLSELSLNEAFSSSLFTKYDLPFLEKCLIHFAGTEFEQKLEHIKYVISSTDFDYSILESTDIDSLISESESGNAVASYRLGEIYEYSLLGEYDPDKAQSYYSDSLNKSCILGIAKNKIINSQEFTLSDNDELSKNGSLQSKLLQIQAFICNLNDKLSVQDAMNILEIEAVTSIHPMVFYLAGKIVKKYYGIEQSDLYVELLNKSSDLGYVMAQVDLMNDYYEGEYLEKNATLCVENAQKAALQGNPEALFSLAVCLFKGFGVMKNKSKAIELLELSAERGYEDATKLLNMIKL